jgi:hypothetical protein
MLACSMAAVCLSGCGQPTPVETVQTYLRMLSGETPVDGATFQSITTECYRSKENKELVNITQTTREWVLDEAQQLRSNPAVGEFLDRITWTTTYDETQADDSDARVVARVIMAEKNPGDREKALAIKDLPQPLADILRRGLELPFQFDLKKANGSWKIDECVFPDSLLTLFESFSVKAGK